FSTMLRFNKAATQLAALLENQQEKNSRKLIIVQNLSTQSRQMFQEPPGDDIVSVHFNDAQEVIAVALHGNRVISRNMKTQHVECSWDLNVSDNNSNPPIVKWNNDRSVCTWSNPNNECVLDALNNRYFEIPSASSMPNAMDINKERSLIAFGYRDGS